MFRYSWKIIGQHHIHINYLWWFIHILKGSYHKNIFFFCEKKFWDIFLSSSETYFCQYLRWLTPSQVLDWYAYLTEKFWTANHISQPSFGPGKHFSQTNPFTYKIIDFCDRIPLTWYTDTYIGCCFRFLIVR